MRYQIYAIYDFLQIIFMSKSMIVNYKNAYNHSTILKMIFGHEKPER